MIEINFHPTRREIRQFACLLLPLFLTAVTVWLAWRRNLEVAPASFAERFEWTTWSWVLLGLAGVSLVLGWVRPSWMRYVMVGWMCAAFPIGWVVSHLVLMLVFYLVITPLGLVMRMCGKASLPLKLDPEAKSYWEARDLNDAKPERYLQQF